MKRHLLASLFLLFAWLAAPGFGQLPRTEALLKDLEGRHLFYGSVLVKRGGANLFQGAYGPHEPPYPVPRNAPDSAYYLAGCGELFGGALAMMAVEKGLMALDEPIGTYVPAFKGRPGPRVRDLLCHASGLVGRLMHPTDKPWTKADTAAWAAEDGLAFPPGSRQAYCGSDFDVLAYALELVAGKPYKQLLAEWIAAPLGLKHTSLGLFPEGDPALAQIYRQSDWNFWLKKTYDGSAALDVYSAPPDLAAFLEALASGRLVSKGSFDLMRTGTLPEASFTKGKGKAGLGCCLTPGGALFSTGRMGGMADETAGYHALALHDPRYGLTVVLLANKWKPDPDALALDVVVPSIYADLGLAE